MSFRFYILVLLLLAPLLAITGCAAYPQADSFAYPASQAELRLRLAQTLNVPYPDQAITYEVRVYCVQVRDSVDSISTKLHVSREQLAALNPGTDLQQLEIGQRLVFYERTSQCTE